MNNIKNIIFDFGAVLVDWNPHYVFDPYFGSKDKADWFIANICTPEWNGEVDKGKPIAQATAERIALYPEWEKEIRLYFDRWIDMIGDAIPGMLELVRQFKSNGYKLYGLSNWARETFNLVSDRFPVFKELDGYIISGDVKMLKPESAIYQEIINKFNLEPSASVFIDDNLHNVKGSIDAGLPAIAFIDCSTLKKDLKELGVRLIP